MEILGIDREYYNMMQCPWNDPVAVQTYAKLGA